MMFKKAILLTLSIVFICSSAYSAQFSFLSSVYALLLKGGGFNLTVGVSGQGSVKSTQEGIDCGTDCTESYSESSPQQVTLVATTKNGSTFHDWSGDVCNASVSPTCTFTMDQSYEVFARFKSGSGTRIVTEEEPNNSPGDADYILLDTAITGVIESRDATDWFQFDSSGGKTLTAHIDSAFDTGDNLILVQLWNNSGTMLNQWTAAKGDSFNINVPDEPGNTNFYLVMKGNGNEFTYMDIPYTVTFDSNNNNPAADPAESEPNNDKNSADALAFDTAIHASTLNADDQDWFVVRNGASLTSTTITFSSTVDDLARVLTVYPEADTTTEPLARIAVKNGTELHLDLPETNKDYFFVVSDLRTQTGNSSYTNAPYTLTVRNNGTTSYNTEKRDNNTQFINTTVIDFSAHNSLHGQCQLTDISGAQQTANDTDWFSFPVVQGETYNFRFSAPETGSYWSVRLYNVTNQVVQQWYPDNTVNQTLAPYTAEASGSAYFEIIGGATPWGDDSMMYTITKE